MTTSVTPPVTTITASVATVTPTISTITASVATVTPTVTSATSIAGWGICTGQRGTLERLDQFEAHFASVDLSDSHLDLITFGQVVLDPLDPLRAVET